VRLEDLDYDLPAALIAQQPAERRDDARLLVVDRAAAALRDARITDLPALLAPGDALAVNETRVRPARIVMRRSSGGRIELLIVRPAPPDRWQVLARPAKRAMPGTRLESADGSLALEVVEAAGEGRRIVRVAHGDLAAALERLGEIPLPPYIHRPATDADRERYQTVFARVDGAVAAPTAGLHFSPALLEALAGRGVARVPLVLHVGPGTFRPVAAADPREHRMDEEWFDIPAASASALRAARAAGGRIVAVGTTSVRALESACDTHGGALEAASGWTRKYILPPYPFQAVDALLTNFHLPRTTLLLLVAAFAGAPLLREAYAHAVRERYRFYSYGDAMLVV
jgi:S-adenosylmethionine:tRNA ribosyltransferase-isomerase